MALSDFNGTEPLFLPETFLVGDLQGWGVLESGLGNLQARFSVLARGELQTDHRTVAFTETWTLDNGMIETLSWLIRPTGEKTYTGTEPQLEGDAKGERNGAAFHWTYTRKTPQKDGGRVSLNFDDWFYMIDENVCIVRGSAGRLGLPFSIAHVTYRKLA